MELSDKNSLISYFPPANRRKILFKQLIFVCFSSTRNWQNGTISGPRNGRNGSAIFPDPETDILESNLTLAILAPPGVQFLALETVNMGERIYIN